ncbi:MAG: 2-hydroxyhepta-2,4-diene-1,7-dioate isomerase [Planctomycetia bacterium]|nr:2-hydroxyhepta-2,4-diene-1,7-dioate isomerase [Planctomycetia bacterium]
MQLGKLSRSNGSSGVAFIENGIAHVLDTTLSLAEILYSLQPAQQVASLPRAESIPLASAAWLPPLDRQEVWAAGVTYIRSKVAREEESASSGASRFYDLVYTAPRPELFFKAPAWRVVAPGVPVRIRKDATWSVPEPELALVVSPSLQIVGYTIGNDMSSRDIEGENPLYLPQAKCYDGSCAVGPFVTLAASMPEATGVTIRLKISRAGTSVFEGTTTLSTMKRSLTELVSWLGREVTFPDGVVLLTGTGIVPPDSFNLASGDVVQIDIAGIGSLINPVA